MRQKHHISIASGDARTITLNSQSIASGDARTIIDRERGRSHYNRSRAGMLAL
ncbi:MAG: hypothetical protein ACRC62_05875 [Microcoleus sp.]